MKKSIGTGIGVGIGVIIFHLLSKEEIEWERALFIAVFTAAFMYVIEKYRKRKRTGDST